MGTDVTIPKVQYLVGLIPQDITHQPQVLLVLRTKEDRLLKQIQIL
jgi:hypothetical protein